MATKVYIVYYSMYGHVEKPSEEIQKGADSVEGVEAKLLQVTETLPEAVLEKERLTAITKLAHHGMIFVPVGYTFGAGMFEMEKVKGGTPYGPGTFAGDKSRMPTELELAQELHLGKHFGRIAEKLKSSA